MEPEDILIAMHDLNEAYAANDVEVIADSPPELSAIGHKLVRWGSRYFLADVLSDQQEADVEARYGGFVDYLQRRRDAGDTPEAALEKMIALMRISAAENAKGPRGTN